MTISNVCLLEARYVSFVLARKSDTPLITLAVPIDHPWQSHPLFHFICDTLYSRWLPNTFDQPMMAAQSLQLAGIEQPGFGQSFPSNFTNEDPNIKP